MTEYDRFKDAPECPSCGEWIGASERAFDLEKAKKQLLAELDDRCVCEEGRQCSFCQIREQVAEL